MISIIKRLAFCSLCAAALVACNAGTAAADATVNPEHHVYKVGFAQSESDGAWRLAETKSMRDVAAACHWDLTVTDAKSSAIRQVADVDALLASGIELLFVAPREEKPLVVAVMHAKRAGIPVILLDRNVDQNYAVSGRDYVTFIGSDFVDQGRRAAGWLIEASGHSGEIIEVEGSINASAANERRRGFDAEIAKEPGMKIVASQSGDFVRDKGRQVTAALLEAHPAATLIFTHNDEMALGAIAAVEAVGKKPGKDIKIVSIDGTREALQAVVAGQLGATVQSSPFMGPSACDAFQRHEKGLHIEGWVKVEDQFFDGSNAAAAIPDAY